MEQGFAGKMDAKFVGKIQKVKDGSFVPDDEWVCFLVKDNAFADVLPYYLARCIKRGADKEQIAAVLRMIERATAWRRAHADRCKTPDAAGEKLLDLI
jgi:hypothetical protein